MLLWLLEHSTYARLAKAHENSQPLTEAQQAEFVTLATAGPGDGSRISATAGGTTEISVTGVLTKSPDFFSRVFGGGNTTYGDLIAALATAQADPDVKRVELMIDSPGGTVDGLFDALVALESFSKPMVARVSSLAASAAFAIAAQADSIEATNPMARFGSIGVMADFFVDGDRVSITSTEAPNKRPDVTTEEGKAVVVKELDALHEVFAEAIAAGRRSTVKKVNENFGQGATVLASEAKKRGMIDKITKTSIKSVPKQTTTKPKTEAADMDLKQLKADHPDVYQAASSEGSERTLASERDRVNALVIAGEQSGDMKTALAAIKDGSPMTATLSTTFMMAAVNNRDLDNRQADDGDVGAATAGAAADAVGQEAGADAVLAQVQHNLGTAVA